MLLTDVAKMFYAIFSLLYNMNDTASGKIQVLRSYGRQWKDRQPREGHGTGREGRRRRGSIG